MCCFSSPSRVLHFDARVFHGVGPGKPDQHRHLFGVIGGDFVGYLAQIYGDGRIMDGV